MALFRVGSAPFASRLAAPVLVTLSLVAAPVVAAGGFQDLLDTPARESALATKTLLNGLAAAGQRLVAVGQRGHIVYSDDNGQSWKQGKVPVASDLVAVSFPSAQRGWAVGHDGVVLHTADGGTTWTRQLDGRSAGQRLWTYYKDLAEKGLLGGLLGSADESARLLAEVEKVAGQGADNPFLDVWFADEQNGFIVGAFNLIFRTADGGKTWEPWFHRSDNPTRLHLYAVRGIGGAVYVAGEQGLLLKLDTASGASAPSARFKAVTTPYKGTYFGLLGSKDAVLVHGLRGNAFRSTDGGSSWQKVETGVQEGLTGATTLGDGRLVLVSQSGKVLLSNDGGVRFAPLKIDRATPASAVLPAGNGALAIAGPRGVRVQPLN